MGDGECLTEIPRPPLSYRMTPRQWAAADVAAAVAAMLVMMFSLRVAACRGHPDGGHGRHTVAATLPVAVRRMWPLLVFAVVTAAVAVLTATGDEPLTTDLMLGMASYMAAVRLGRPVAVAGLVAVEAAIGAGLLTAAATVHAQNVMLHSMLAAAAMWFVGAGVRERRTYQAALAEQAAQRQRAEAERGRHALQQERLLIARELHDVLAHTLSVVTVQAGVGRRVGAARPARRCARSPRSRRRAGARSMSCGACLPAPQRRRDTAAGAAGPPPRPRWRPRPASATWAAWRRWCAPPGPRSVDVAGDVAAVPPAAGLTAYRIVQEALTNVVRHAPGARRRRGRDQRGRGADQGDRYRQAGRAG